MWWTPMAGTPQAQARLRPKADPTSRAPIKPGPAVKATPSMESLDKPGLVEDLTDQGEGLADMVAGGELRHHAAELGVDLDLTVDGMSEQSAVAVVDGNAGLVAGGLDS